MEQNDARADASQAALNWPTRIVMPIACAYGSAAVLLASGLLSFAMVATFLFLKARQNASVAAAAMRHAAI